MMAPAGPQAWAVVQATLSVMEAAGEPAGSALAEAPRTAAAAARALRLSRAEAGQQAPAPAGLGGGGGGVWVGGGVVVIPAGAAAAPIARSQWGRIPAQGAAPTL